MYKKDIKYTDAPSHAAFKTAEAAWLAEVAIDPGSAAAVDAYQETAKLHDKMNKELGIDIPSAVI
jgi:hypothetical protein